MIAPAAAPTLHRLSNAAAILALAAVAAALLLPDAYAAVPEELRPGAWSQDMISAAAALALLAINVRLRQGWAKGWLIWAGLIGYLIYAYGLYSFDHVMNPAYLIYLAVLSITVFAALFFLRAFDPSALKSSLPRSLRLSVSVLFGVMVTLFGVMWLAQLFPAMSAGQALPVQTILVLDLVFALPLVALTAISLWRGTPLGDLLAIPMLMKVAVLGVSVFLGTLLAWAFFDGPFKAFDLALYALIGFGPAALIWPVWRGLDVVRAT